MRVTQYLTWEALEAICQFALSLAPASEIVFSFILLDEAVSGIEAAALTTAAERAAEAGGAMADFTPANLERSHASSGG